jgi:ribose transport system substrate-binding protein
MIFMTRGRLSQRFLVVLGSVLLAGCGGGDGVAPRPARQVFGASFQSLNNPVLIEINNGLKAAVEARGARLITSAAQFNHQKQMTQIAELLQQRPAAIFINPVNWEGIKDGLIAAKRKQVPIIIVDAPVSDPDLVLCQVASDNVEAGRLACEALAKVKPAAKLVILHLSMNRACIDRVAGFKMEMAKHPDMKILDIQEGTGSAVGARPVMADTLKRFPELDAAFPVNEPSALGAVLAIEAARRSGQMTVVTVDGSREGLAAVQAGRLYASVAQSPRDIGRIAAEKVFEHLAGKVVEKNTKVPVKLITRENAVGFFESQ